MKFSIKMNCICIFLYLLLTIDQTLCAVCPAPAIVSPCKCESNGLQIICSGDTAYDLNSVFTKISANGTKHFDELILTNSAITSLNDNVFADVSFKKISITGAYHLNRISAKALNASAFTLEEFRQIGENELTDTNIEPLFDALSSLVSVNRIYLELTKATKIPDNAFKIINGRQTTLESIHLNFIGGKFGSIESVGNKAFYYLDNLKYLSLANQPIRHLKAQAFDFEKPSNTDMDLHLEATKMTADSFEAGIFLNSKRPITVEMSENHLDYLDEKVFKPIFQLPAAKMITVIIEKNLMVCNCKVEWMVKDKDELKYRIMEPTCADGTSLWDHKSTEFANCLNSTLVD